MKLVLSCDYGSFRLSNLAYEKLHDLTGIKIGLLDEWLNKYRFAPELVSVVEELGDDASAVYSKLCIVEIPDEASDFKIYEYDGVEWVVYALDGKLYEEWGKIV